MKWTGLTREELDEMLVHGLEAMDDAVQVAWSNMRIEPEKWQCSPWGDDGGGFWAVAEKDGHVVWYNDIEDGFNTSSFKTRGIIENYSCDQTSFEEFLLRLPEAKAADNWCDKLATCIIPVELQNGGAIARRQTTYWTLHANGGSAWRLHFKSKAETKFVDPKFSKLEIVESHPFLEQYREPWAELFFSGATNNPGMLTTMLAERIEAATGGWREIGEYFNRSADLGHGYGLLMRAPMTLVKIASDALAEKGIKTSTIESARPTDDVQAVIMDRNVIIAHSFRFEKIK